MTVALTRCLVRSYRGPLPVLVKLRQDHETPVAKRSESPKGQRLCQAPGCGKPITMKSGKYGKVTCSPACRNRYNGLQRSLKVANRGAAEQLAIVLGKLARNTEQKATTTRARAQEGLCRRCSQPRAQHSKVHCQTCLDAIATRRRQIQDEGRCRECKQPRGESPSFHYCASCLKTHNDRGYRGAPRKWTRPRKRTPEMEPVMAVSAKVPASFYARVEDFMARYDMTLSTVIREALDCYMDIAEHEEPEMLPTRPRETRPVAAIALLLLALPWNASAQAPALPDHVEVMVLPATGDPMTVAPVASLTTDIGAAAACNLASSPAAAVPLTNPTIAEFDDPFTAGRVCRVPLPPLAALPNGTDYRVVVVAIADTCEIAGKPATDCRGPRSAVAIPPFNVNRAGPPAALTRPVVRP